jgi:vacuolar-type H+-ATPase subunit C/Vma6
MSDFYMYSFEKGLKTMSYYFRTTAAIENAKVTVNTNSSQNQSEEDDDCLVCGS